VATGFSNSQKRPTARSRARSGPAHARHPGIAKSNAASDVFDVSNLNNQKSFDLHEVPACRPFATLAVASLCAQRHWNFIVAPARKRIGRHP
jgi:hypothetical protein